MRAIKCISEVNDTYDNVDSIILNGRVKSIDPATGNERDSCILSVSTGLAEFNEVNLEAVDPKAWFKSSKGVSAVRDLYAVVVHEGAIKGILVTTSGFGNDSYEFANDKPLTLINGGELLYLLEKYGHKAYIDVAEAKRLGER